jgi:hypothetical protein
MTCLKAMLQWGQIIAVDERVEAVILIDEHRCKEKR